MPIIAKAEAERHYTPAPAGAHIAVCCDVVDLGMVDTEYQGVKKKQPKIRIVWELPGVPLEGTEGRFQTCSARLTLSLHEKAGLRKMLQSWRGRPFTAAELAGFDVETIIGAPCFLNIVHKVNGEKTYANVEAVMPLPAGMPKPTVSAGYTRAKDRPGKDAPPETAQQFGAMVEQVVTDTITDADIPF
jgi:hypothetical protein